MASNAPWYTYPRIDNFGTIDPQGNYWKPDSNIQLPGYYPITALLPGTVTSVQTTQWGQTVVTVKLDAPINSEATHTFYEHMSSAAVNVGQHVSAGDLIGNNNPPGTVPLGFGLYSGDVYGSGSAWQQLQSDLSPGGAGLLNPVALLNAAMSGQLNQWLQVNNAIPSSGLSSTGGSGCTSCFQSWSCFLTCLNVGSQVTPGPGGTIVQPGVGLIQQVQQVLPWLTNPMRIVKMLTGIMLIGLAIFLMASPDAARIATKVGV